MARNTQVSYEEVAQACAELFAKGESVSFPRVYALIGNRGGNAVVTGLIKRWREEVAGKLDAQRTSLELGSPELVDAADGLVAKLWKLAMAEAEKQFEEARRQLAESAQEWQRQISLAEEARDTAYNRAGEFEHQLELAKAANEAREQAYLELESRHAETAAKLATREDQISSMREDYARVVTTLEAERTQHSQEIAGERQRHEAALAAEREKAEVALQAEKDRHTAEMNLERERAEADRKHLMRQTDEIRQAATLQADHLRERLANVEALEKNYRQQAGQFRDEAATWKGRAEAAEAMLAKLTTRKEKKPKPTPETPAAAAE